MTSIKKLSKEKIINSILNALIGIFSVILLISIYTGVQIKLLDHDYANFFGYSMFEVETNSMQKEISAGDWIIVKLNSKIELNDIITFKKDDNYITHRVVEIHQGTYVTMGDANPSKDEKPVDQSQVVGKVTKILSGFGILRKTVFNPIVLIMFIIVLYLFDSLSKDTIKSNFVVGKVKKIGNKLVVKVSKKDSETKILPKLDSSLISYESLVVDEEINEVENLVENVINIDNEIKSKSEIIEVSMPEIKDNFDDDFNIKTDLDELEELEDYDYVADELEKTQFFRIIPVDEGEIDKARLEIAHYEMAEQNKKIEVPDVIKPIIEEPEDDGLTNINLDLIRKNTRRNKNMIDAIMNIKKDEINEIIDHILVDEKVQTNEPTIKNILITTYIHARYYNYYNEKDLDYKGKKIITKTDKILDIIAEDLIKEYDSTDSKYEEKVKKILAIMKTFNLLDQGKDRVTDIKSKREYYRSSILKANKDLEPNIDSIVNNIINTQKNYEGIIKYFLKKFETNAFYLDINKIKNKKNYYTAEIEHNITFNKVYSDYIIDKTYTEGIVSEDKISVLFVLLLTQMIEDMITTTFDNKYVINIPSTLFEKEKKLAGLLKAVDDQYAKNHMLFLIDFSILVNYKKHVKKLKRDGYRFVIAFKNHKNLLAKDRNCLYLGDAIFVDNNEKITEILENYIPADLQDSIIYGDIYDKFNIEGE